MKPFEEADRYKYPLTPGSVVLDCGGYEGRWTEDIHERYHCTIHVLEPVRRFYDNVVKRVGGRSGVFVHPWGIGEQSGDAVFSIQNDSTGAYAAAPEHETVTVKTVEDIFKALGLGRVDLMKINIEGGEFTAIAQLIETGLINQVDNIQVQWHHVGPASQELFDALQRGLAKTHHLEFDGGWVWQGWRKNA